MDTDKNATFLGDELSEQETMAIVNSAMMDKTVKMVKLCGNGIAMVFSDSSGISFVFDGAGFSMSVHKMVPIATEGMVQ